MTNIKTCNIAKPEDIWSFEFRTTNPDFQYYVEVVHTHKHHFTGEIMRYVRMDHISFGKSETFYDFLNEEEWADILSRRIVR